ncbi:MAG: ferritin family protein [Candidatus Neomarinimicrobiota bacterium]
MPNPKPDKFTDLGEILSFAMEEEQEAALYYQKMAHRTDDPEMKEFFIKLADMEVDHFNSLKMKLMEYEAREFSSEGIRSSFCKKQAGPDSLY